MLTYGSLYAGNGGIDLGFDRAGLKCRWQVEIDSHANRVLDRNFPGVWRHRDVRSFPPSHSNEWEVDVVAGGFPCQDISWAGHGVGLGGARSGLFVEMLRIVRLLRPAYVLMENVAALLVRGIGVILGQLQGVLQWG